MNKHLVNFINDELKHNDYYQAVREFAKGKDWNQDILSPVVNEYDDHIDHFGPYRFLDAIEDFLREEFEDENLDIINASSLDEVIYIMWDKDAFEQY